MGVPFKVVGSWLSIFRREVLCFEPLVSFIQVLDGSGPVG